MAPGGMGRILHKYPDDWEDVVLKSSGFSVSMVMSLVCLPAGHPASSVAEGYSRCDSLFSPSLGLIRV